VTSHQEPPSTQPSLLSAIVDFQNEAAWRRFMATYEEFILSRCMGCGLNATDAEDVKQSVVMALARAMPQFQYNPKQRFRGYLTTVVVNTVKKLRAKQARQPGSSGSGEAGQKSKIETLPDRDFVEELAISLDSRLGRDVRNLSLICERVRAQVKEHTWVAYIETAIECQSAVEVAKRLGVSAGVVYSAKYRVGIMLREAASELCPEVNERDERGPLSDG
jgi:RNA polymerase sigma-70 factor, ECF subfamily